jgi:hypothetical protein
MATEYRNNVSCQKTSAFVLGFNWHFSLLNHRLGINRKIQRGHLPMA